MSKQCGPGLALGYSCAVAISAVGCLHALGLEAIRTDIVAAISALILWWLLLHLYCGDY